ncbi:exopolysaccharide biosynthesis polyprenyl glycosylphosphotransferase [Meiothermus rufus]|uniref:exopolysaccharide biosynthesis polyprenyl glycosylphosphotransferase n=1 Tax=Meiothermus rufus TaxID=604332 RepID=UPI00041B5858|nr:exopolysaccharide biosynthesis polyprenyl glycosylphosphotransferase [Meiothermus rufus]
MAQHGAPWITSPAEDTLATAPAAWRRPGWVPVILWLSDVFALELSLLLALGVHTGLFTVWPQAIPLGEYTPLALVLTGFPLGYFLWALYPGYGLHPVERMRQTLIITTLLFGCIGLGLALIPATQKYAGVMALTGGFALLLVPLLNALVRELLIRAGYWGQPVVILGAGLTGAMVARALKRDRYLGLVPVAFLDDDPNKQHRLVEGIPVVGALEQAEQLSRQGVREALVAISSISRAELKALVHRLPFLQVIVVPDLGEQTIDWFMVRDLGRIHGLSVRKNLLLPHNRAIKWWIDRLLGWPLFVLSLPLIGLLALWIRLVSPGSPFFTQVREGYKGQPIRILKLRTMYPDAEERLTRYLAENPQAQAEWERTFKLKHDPRILPGVGSFLRKTSLDELPQLYNVVRGEMSLVGPRPFPIYHLERFSPEFRQLRYSVLPGMTGLWQVLARADSDLKLQEELDTYYIRNWSPWLDIYLLFRTVLAVLGAKGAY